MRSRLTLIFFIALTMSCAVMADNHKGLRISQAHARATAPGQSSAAVYLTIENTGASVDELVAVKSPAATTASLHSMAMKGNVMQMREVDHITVAPAATAAMVAGHGYHVMLSGLRHPLVAGQKIPLVLTFKNSGVVKTNVTIDGLTSTP